MEVRRTVPVKLDMTDSDAALLHDTIDQFRDAANHVVRHARDDDGYVITSKRRLHAWAFRRLYEYVEYKAAERGIAVEQVNPQYTSQRCSHTDCGFTHPDNRQSQDSFCCGKCGYEIHADYNAAKNIGFKYLRRSHTSSDGDVLENRRFSACHRARSVSTPVGVRIHTRTLNTSGFEPAPDSVRVGVHGESPAL